MEALHLQSFWSMFIYSNLLNIVSSWVMNSRLWILNKSEYSFKIEIKYNKINLTIICIIVIVL